MTNLLYASSKIMTFNTMCDLCKGSQFWEYQNRLNSIVQIIQSYSPDLIALQEVRSQNQIDQILKRLPHFGYYNIAKWPLNYADPTILYNKNKFVLKDAGQAWLGPTPNRINLGWKLSLPRQYLWVRLERLDDAKNFIFSTTHFDNRIENQQGSALYINKIFKDEILPVIFAGDTNLTVDTEYYSDLIKNVFINAFDIKKNILQPLEKNHRDFCYLKKGKVFPKCRVDHILLSMDHDWKVDQFYIDQTKNHKGNFPSDHRPVIIDLTF